MIHSRLLCAFAAAAIVLASPGLGLAQQQAAGRSCASLVREIDAVSPSGAPAFIESYRPGPDEPSLPVGLAGTAFVYDNAVAAIALVACGEVARARRIGDALVVATNNDRTFADGRVRNAYRAGPVSKGPPALPGWWLEAQKLWAEDPYQDGTATGNVAWAMLALLTLHKAAGDPAYLAGAEQLLAWIETHAGQAKAHGWKGGTFGYDPQQVRIRWASTEHNIDVAAAAEWLFRITGNERHAAIAARARRFVTAAFEPNAGYFLVGTRTDGSLSTGHVVLDVQLWPWMAMRDAPPDWRRALAYAEQHLSADGGFDFNSDRDGIWIEGTAQAALAYRIIGNPERTRQLLQLIETDRSPNGLLYASRRPKLTTGLSIQPEGEIADFFYFRRPHLGATAWAALAETGWNPFTGDRTDR